MDFLWPILHNPGTVFTVPKQSKWAVHGQPTLPTPVPLGETDFHSYSRSHTYQHRIKCINSNTSAHMNFWAFTDSPNVQKYFHNSVPCFGTDQQPIPDIYSHQACILLQNFQHKDPNSPQIFWAVTAILEKSQKFPQVRSHVLGPIKRPLTASN